MVAQLRAPVRREDLQLPSYVPDTTTPAVLVDELLALDGPHADYADHWVRVGGVHFAAPAQAVTNAA